MLRLKEALEDAKDYAAHRAAFEGGDRREYALSRLDLEALVPVVEGKLPLVVTVNRASDIRAALRLGKEYGLKLILASVIEGWKVSGEIKAAGVPVLMDPMDNLPQSFEALGATLENAARLRKTGVTVAFMSGESHNARRDLGDRGALRHARAGQGSGRGDLGRRSAGGDERRRAGLHPRRRDAARHAAPAAPG
jgi:hypothetical protein